MWDSDHRSRYTDVRKCDRPLCRPACASADSVSACVWSVPPACWCKDVDSIQISWEAQFHGLVKKLLSLGEGEKGTCTVLDGNKLKSNSDKKTWGLFCCPWRCVLGPRTLRNVGEAGHVPRDGWADAESEDPGVRRRQGVRVQAACGVREATAASSQHSSLRG